MREAEANGATILGRMLVPYTALRGKRNLQLLFGGQVVSSFGDWLYVLALAVLVYDLTGSTTFGQGGCLGVGMSIRNLRCTSSMVACQSSSVYRA